MKNQVRDIFLSFYDLFESLVSLNENFESEILNIQNKTDILIKKSSNYSLLEIENCNFEDHILINSTTKDVLCSILSKIIIDNLFSLHITKYQKQNYYEERLILILAKLDFIEYEKIYVVHKKFVDDSLFSTIKLSYLQYSYEQLNKLKEKPLFTQPTEDYKLNQTQYQNIDNLFNEAIYNYHDYIENNYHTISSSFAYYNKDIRLYILDAPKNGAFTCKLLSYNNNNKLSVKVFTNILTLANKFGNIEEIDKDLSSSILSLFDFENLSVFNRHFEIRRIHYELIQIYLRLSSTEDIFKLLLFVVSLSKTEVFNVNYNDHSYIIDKNESQIKIKCHFEKEIDTKRILNNNTDFDKHIFLTQPDTTIISTLKNDKINYYNQYIDQQYHLEAIHYYIKDNLTNKEFIINQSYGSALYKERLNNCVSGIKDWSKYEELCIEIFEYLFKNSFRNYIVEKQSNTESGILRRDLIINNLPKETNTFWGDIKSTYGSNLIICEFKNYTEPLNSNTLYNTTKYINNQNRVILTFSRNGLDNSAKHLQLRLLKERNMLILSLTDKDLYHMLNEMELGINPLYRLENLKFELEKLV